MSAESKTNNDRDIRDAFRRAFGGESIPLSAQVKLDEAYARLEEIPQVKVVPARELTQNGTQGSTAGSHNGTRGAVGNQRAAQRAAGSSANPAAELAAKPIARRPFFAARKHRKQTRMQRRVAVVAATIAFMFLLGGAAYAASYLLKVGPFDTNFFSGKTLPVYDSLEPDAASLSAEVGQSQVIDEVTLTFDTVSCDRNLINLFFTVEKEGGFDLDDFSSYEGSSEGEWARLQRLIPSFRYEISSEGELLDEGPSRSLDAYLEDGKVKSMLRITPKKNLPEQIDLALDHGVVQQDGGSDNSFKYSVGLDLSSVPAPKELGAQDIVFHTEEGDKTLSIERFTTSEFGTVFVTKNPIGQLDDGSIGFPDDKIDPSVLKISDKEGNVLNPVDTGDGGGFDLSGSLVFEFSGDSLAEGPITFTPMLSNESYGDESRGYSGDALRRSFDATQIGVEIPLSEFGGYTLKSRTVSGSTLTLAFQPYGWIYGAPSEFIPEEEDVTLLYGENYYDEKTGETRRSAHSAIRYMKQDYKTGEFLQIDSYYAASEEELQNIKTYYYLSDFGVFKEDAAAAVELPFTEA